MPQVKFWNPALTYQKLKPEIDAAIQDVLSSGNLICGYGGYVEKFEKEFADYIGVKHCVMTGAGTHALYLVYKALGLGPGDEVITTSMTFIATIDQIVAVGAIPVLVDTGDDGLIDPEEVKKVRTSQTKAIVPVHLEGKLCHTSALYGRIHSPEQFDPYIIEDAAQAIGASGERFKAGNLGHAGCFSFYPAKLLGGLGNSGAITTNDDKLAARLRDMRSNGRIGKNPDIENAEYGTNMEPDNIQAAVLSVKMKYLDSFIKRRQEIAEMYDEGLKNLEKSRKIILPLRQIGRVYQDYCI